MLADELGERRLIPAPKRVEEHRFLKAHGGDPTPPSRYRRQPVTNTLSARPISECEGPQPDRRPGRAANDRNDRRDGRGGDRRRPRVAKWSAARVSRVGDSTRAHTPRKTLSPGPARRPAGRGRARLRSRCSPDFSLAAAGPATGRIER